MKALKRSELPKELLEQMDKVGENLKPLNQSETNPLQKFLKIRNQEVWDEGQVRWLFQFFTNIAVGYFPEAPESHRLIQDTAVQILGGLTVASTEEGERDPAKRIAYGPMPLGYVKLSDRTIERLNQCYADFYLIRHKEPKAEQILEALPYITKSGETMAWFVARIVNICRKKSLRLSFESDLATAGMKLVETQRTFSVVYSHITKEDETTVRTESEKAFGKKGGGLS